MLLYRFILGWVVQLELLSLDRAAQVVLERVARHRVHIHLRLEELVIVAAAALGVIHREIGVLQQRLCIVAVTGISDDADARGHVQLVMIHLVWPAQRHQYLARAHGCVFGMGYLGQKHHELVTTLPAHGIRRAHAVGQALRHRLQQAIADQVPERVVDVLEAIHVQVEHGHAAVVASRERNGSRQAIIEQHSVG